MEINSTTDLIPIVVSFIYSVRFCLKFIEGSSYSVKLYFSFVLCK